MTTLPFRLPDFTRVIWHSAAARDTWGPRISRMAAAWGAMERLAVVEGHRQACLTFFDPAALPVAAQQAVEQGLVLIPLTVSGVTAQYSATPQAPVAGRPFQFRAVLVRPEYAKAWVAAWNGGQVDDAAVGALLGYPRCCRAFFQRVWVDGAGVDTSWQMGVGTAEHEERTWDKGHEVRVTDTPPEANILWRWMGVRLVPHLPCSFTCEHTVRQAREFVEVGRKYGYAEEVEWMLEVLSWPVEWAALHGIAEIRTPVFTVSTRTDATRGYRVVQRHSTAPYPTLGAQGLRFPFQRVKEQLVTAKPAFRRAFPVWERNGFGSEEAMNQAHEVVLRALPVSTNGGTLLDLGCGSGRLLKRAETRGYVGRGIEVDASRAADPESRVVVGSLFDVTLWDESYDVVALMPGRLVESGVTEEMAQAVRNALTRRAKYLLLYAYGDWMERETLPELARRAGFVVPADVVVHTHEHTQALVLAMA